MRYSYTIGYLFQGIQISRILWILGISTEFVLPKISGDSIVTQIADWREDSNVDSWK